MPFEPRKCMACGAEFTPKIKNQRYCRLECRKSSYKPKPPRQFEPKNCAYCGKEFTPLNYQRQIYCDKSCAERKHRELNIQPKIEKICLMCQKTFLTPSRTREFCKPFCRERFRKLERRIFNLYWDKEEQKQLKLLKELGKDYRFPPPNENLNAFYELGVTRNNKKRGEVIT